jgi:hypothetical protein
MKLYTLIVISASIMIGATTDPFVGTWKLSVQKSKYAPGASPKSMVIEIRPAGDGIRYSSDTINANGNPSHSEYIASYNGKEAPVKGLSGPMMPVSLKRIDANTVEASFLKAHQAVATSRRVVSKDGQTMTITTTTQDLHGKPVTNVGVYEKLKGS